MAEMSRRKVTYGDKFRLYTVSPFAKNTVEKLGGYLGVLFHNTGLAPLFCAPPVQAPYDGVFETCYFRIVDPNTTEQSLSKDVRFGDAFSLEIYTEHHEQLSGSFREVAPNTTLADICFIFSNPSNSTEVVYYDTPNVTLNIIQTHSKSKSVKSGSIRPLPLNLARGISTTISTGYLTSLQPRSRMPAHDAISTGLQIKDQSDAHGNQQFPSPHNYTAIDDEADLSSQPQYLASSVFQIQSARFELRPYNDFHPLISLSLATISTDDGKTSSGKSGGSYHLPSTGLKPILTNITQAISSSSLSSTAVVSSSVIDAQPIGPTVQPLIPSSSSVPLSLAKNVKIHGNPLSFDHFEHQPYQLFHVGDLNTGLEGLKTSSTVPSKKKTPSSSSSSQGAKSQHDGETGTPNVIHLKIRDLGEIVLPITALTTPPLNLCYSTVSPPTSHQMSEEYADYDAFTSSFTRFPLHKHPDFQNLYSIDQHQQPPSPTTQQQQVMSLSEIATEPALDPVTGRDQDIPSIQEVSSFEEVHKDGYGVIITTVYTNGQRLYSSRVNAALIGTRLGNRVVLPINILRIAIPPQYVPFSPISHGQQRQAHPQFSFYPRQVMGATWTTFITALFASYMAAYCFNEFPYYGNDYLSMLRVVVPTIIMTLIGLFYPFLFSKQRYQMSFKDGLTENTSWHIKIQKPHTSLDYNRLLTSMGLTTPRQVALDQNNIELLQILEGVSNSALITDGVSLLNSHHRMSGLFYMAPAEQEKILTVQQVLEKLDGMRNKQLSRKVELYQKTLMRKPLASGGVENDSTSGTNKSDALISLTDGDVDAFSLLTPHEISARYEMLSSLIDNKLDDVTYSILALDCARPDPLVVNAANQKVAPLTPGVGGATQPPSTPAKSPVKTNESSKIAIASPSKVLSPPVPPSLKTALGSSSMTVKAYYPFLFHAIREAHNITPADFANSWTFFLDQLPKMDLGAGRSGSLFMRSRCNNFIFKTLSKDDMTTLHMVIHDYAHHVISTPSLLMRFFGVYRLKFNHPKTQNTENIYVLIGDNIFDIPKTIPYANYYSLVTKYDLKGRKPKKDPHKRLQTAHRDVYKDNQVSRAFELHETVRDQIIATLSNDVAWLQQHDCIDYSLLVGVAELHEDAPFVPKIPDNSLHHQQIGIPGYVKAQYDEEFFKVGIVDFLARFSTFKKKTAHFLKSTRWTDEELSTVDSQFYGDRFKQYLNAVFPEPGAILVRTRSEIEQVFLTTLSQTPSGGLPQLTSASSSASPSSPLKLSTAQSGSSSSTSTPASPLPQPSMAAPTVSLPKSAIEALDDSARSAGTVVIAPNGQRIVILPRGVANSPVSIVERSKLTVDGIETSKLDTRRRRSLLLPDDPILYPSSPQPSDSAMAPPL